MDSTSPLTTANLEEGCERYQKMYAGLVYDVLEQLCYTNQVLSHEITSLAPEMKLAGPAFTVKGTTTAEKDESLRFRRLEALKEMRHPCIEVRDRSTPYNVALYGELSATAARAHGAVGALVDGGARDSGMLVAMNFPVFARYRSPVEAFGRCVFLNHQIPILVSLELTEILVVNHGNFMFEYIDVACSI